MAIFILLSIVFLLLPAIFWVWFFRSIDIYDKEPKTMIFKLFVIWGTISSIFAISLYLILEIFLPDLSEIQEEIIFGDGGNVSIYIISVFLLWVVIEEIAKFIVLWAATYHSKFFTQIIDGVIYGVSVALGFSFFENVSYFVKFTQMDLGGAEFFYAMVSRAIYPVMLHLVTTGIVGLYLGKKKFSPSHSRIFIIKGVLIAILIHIGFNLSLLLLNGIFATILSFSIVFAGLVYLIWEISKFDNRMIWKFTRK